ncbi:hypothetical protein B9Z55_003875 [Caenorhabditis nigoni]|uniref:Uncharacterized protein n=1 Tax=Caenorhabditis nigoni TaxID=1611254 RepID=A0A2G5VSJ4_9PELO|nr:hypothetical protein B9Z55_003875 [Caenorhabditis nigoni]
MIPTTPSSRLSGDAPSTVNIAHHNSATSPTSTDTDAMNGRSTSSKATQQHGRQSDQITNGTWNFKQRLDGKNIINNLGCSLDRKDAVNKVKLQRESTPIGRGQEEGHKYNPDLRQEESSPVGQKLQRSRRTQDTNQDDSPSSRSPEDVPSKSNGPMDITVTSTDWQWNFQRKLEVQVNDIWSGCCHHEDEIKPTTGTIQSRHLPSRSSTQGVKLIQVKQTVSTRRSPKPERSAKRVRHRNLLMKVVEVRKSSCKRILTNGYNSCATRTPEVAVTSIKVAQRTDDQGIQWRTSSK